VFIQSVILVMIAGVVAVSVSLLVLRLIIQDRNTIAGGLFGVWGPLLLFRDVAAVADTLSLCCGVVLSLIPKVGFLNAITIAILNFIFSCEFLC